MYWTDSVWERTLPVYDKITSQPFIRELGDGSLDEAKFARYIAQDEIYLATYCPLMDRMADLLPTPEDRAFMHEFAKSGEESEKYMHSLLIERFGIMTDVMLSPVTKRYCDFLRRSVESGDGALAIAAMLPCSWVYNRVGLHIYDNARLEGNPYAEWIEAYSNEEFNATIARMLEIVDRMAAALGPEGQRKMADAYAEATIYEHAFWDYGYRGEAGDYSYIDEWLKTI